MSAFVFPSWPCSALCFLAGAQPHAKPGPPSLPPSSSASNPTLPGTGVPQSSAPSHVSSPHHLHFTAHHPSSWCYKGSGPPPVIGTDSRATTTQRCPWVPSAAPLFQQPTPWTPIHCQPRPTSPCPSTPRLPPRTGHTCGQPQARRPLVSQSWRPLLSP